MTSIKPGREDSFIPQGDNIAPETDVKVSFCGGGSIRTTHNPSSKYPDPEFYRNISVPSKTLPNDPKNEGAFDTNKIFFNATKKNDSRFLPRIEPYDTEFYLVFTNEDGTCGPVPSGSGVCGTCTYYTCAGDNEQGYDYVQTSTNCVTEEACLNGYVRLNQAPACSGATENAATIATEFNPDPCEC